MEKKTFEEVARMWQEEKRHYVKRSTYAAYALLKNEKRLSISAEPLTPEERLELPT